MSIPIRKEVIGRGDPACRHAIVESGSLRGMSRWNRALSFGFVVPLRDVSKYFWTLLYRFRIVSSHVTLDTAESCSKPRCLLNSRRACRDGAVSGGWPRGQPVTEPPENRDDSSGSVMTAVFDGENLPTNVTSTRVGSARGTNGERPIGTHCRWRRDHHLIHETNGTCLSVAAYLLMDAVVLAGGYVTRLWPVTKHRPKMLLPVGESTVLDRIPSELEADDRIDDVYISTDDRFADEFREHLAASDSEKPRLSVEDTTGETEKFGVIGALA